LTSGKRLPEMMSDKKDITTLIPQRAPFIMVDKILSSENGKTITSFYIKEDNILSKDGFFREPGMIENIAQSVAAGRGYEGAKENKAPQIGYIGSIKALQIHFFPKINTEIKTEICILNQVLNFTSVSGKIFSDNKIAAECELVIAVSE
jgi:3-hydroxymyristoyl/3-hydroxydecanoyl-(acyl carrier protein) dehydratase